MTEPSRPRDRPRLEGLDALRGIAAIAVVLFHFTVQFPKYYEPGVAAFSFDYGFYGVNLFFMISGFVILMSLEKSGGTGFVQSRFIRLFPTYWAALLLTTSVLLLTDVLDARPTAIQIAVNLTMFEEFVHVPTIDGSYWSLTYELGFYIMMFAVFQTRLRAHIAWLPVWMTVGAALFPLIVKFVPHPLHLMIGVNYYSHLFAAGMALYLIRRDGPSPALLMVCAAAPLIQAQQDGIAGGIAMALAVAAMVWATGPNVRLPRRAAPLLWLGTVSYALYLVHQMIGFVLLANMQQAGLSPTLSLVLAITSVLILAAGLTFLVEKPAMRHLPSKLARVPFWRLNPGFWLQRLAVKG